MKKRNIPFIICFIVLLLSCTASKVEKIIWQGELIKKNDDIEYISWKDGNQFITKHQDSITVSLAGFDFEDALYIVVSLTNNKSKPLNFLPKNSKITYSFEKKEIELRFTSTKNLDPEHFSFFNSVLSGAGKLSRFFLNIPVDMVLGASNDDVNSSAKISGEYDDDNIKMTKKLFISNHTLFPGTNYSGFMVFEYNSEKSIKGGKFELAADIGTIFKMTGAFITEVLEK